MSDRPGATARTRIEIGGVSFQIRGEGAIHLAEPGPPYAGFTNDANQLSTCHPTIDIAVLASPEPLNPGDGSRQIFDCPEGWQLFKGQCHYTIVLQSGEADKPFCTVRASNDWQSAVVACGPERYSVAEDYRIAVANPFSYPLDQVFLMHVLARNEGVILHAAGVEFHGKCYLFPGVSGAGKSTLSRLLASAAGMEVLSDDRMVVRKMDGDVKAYGTPWPGDAGFAVNRGATLGGIFFLTKASGNRVIPLTPAQALNQLFPVASIPWYEREMVSDMLAFCEELVRRVPAYDLFFRPDRTIIDTLSAIMAT
jgi:hypothetical protein